MKPIIEIKNITKVYNDESENRIKVLDDISLKIDEGEYVAIMGTSGVGKTTLLNILSLIDTPTNGNVFLDGHNANLMSEKDIRDFRAKKLSFVFQDFNLIESLTIFENVSLPLLINNQQREMDRQINKVLEELNIFKIKDKYPHECSGGEIQRAAIARALVMHPKILIADEPTGNLDSKNTKELMEIFEKLYKENMTIIMVTHDAFVASYASRILIMDDGKINKDILKEDVPQQSFFSELNRKDGIFNG